VSIEVSPTVAASTRATINFAEDLRDRCRRPNVMVKIPATKEGLPAIEDPDRKGPQHQHHADLRRRSLRRGRRGIPVGTRDIAEKGRRPEPGRERRELLRQPGRHEGRQAAGAKIQAVADPAQKRDLERLYGKAAIANSKVAYEHFAKFFSGARWERLRKAGARTQAPAVGQHARRRTRATPTPYYVEELIGPPNTVDTIPPATLAAFREHGEVRRSLDESIDLAKRQLKQLAEIGVDLGQVTHELEVEGVDSFTKSFESLLAAIAQTSKDIKAGRGRGSGTASVRFSPPSTPSLRR